MGYLFVSAVALGTMTQQRIGSAWFELQSKPLTG
jgi:hypothetical protein